MSIPGSALTFLGAASGAGDAGFKIERSLRFNDDDSAYLSRTFSAGNRQSWTWSGWVKRSELGSGRRALFGAYGASNDTDLLEFGFQAGGIYATTNSTTFLTAEVFRDPSAWYHYFVRYNGSNIKFFINGNEVYSWAKTGDLGINGAWEHNVGRGPATGGRYHDGYLAEVHFVDGQALAVTDFGEFDATTGVWNPIEFTGSHNPAATNYDSLLTVPGGFASGEGAANAFDGSTSTRAKASTADDIFTFDLSSLNLTGSFEFWATNASSEYSLDGGTTWTSSLSSQYTTATSDISGVSNIKFKPSSGTTMKVTAFRNQGNVLVNTPAGVNGFYLNFSDNSTDDALGTDSSGNNNTWDDNNLSADGPSVATTGNISLSNNVNRNFFFKGSVGDTFSCTLGNHVWDSPDGATWTYRGTSQTSVTLTQIYVVVTGSTDISFTNSNSASVEYWDLPLSTGIANGAGTTTTFNIISYGAGNIDSLIDTPTNYEADSGNNGGNYATLNPLALGDNITLSNGNLYASEASTSGHTWAKSTIGVKSGKWYVEVTVESATGPNNFGLTNYSRQHTGWIGTDGSALNQFNIVYNNGSSRTILDGNVAMSQTISGGQWTVGDVLQFAYDADNGKAWFGINNTWYQANGSSTTLSAVEAGTNATFVNFAYDSEYFFTTDHHDAAFTHNYGQRPFAYTPPSGYKSLCTQNLATPPIADGSDYFDIQTYDGTGTSQTLPGLSFTADLLWRKSRSADQFHNLVDSVRGLSNALITNDTYSEQTGQSNVSNVTSTGYDIGTEGGINTNNETYVAWAWDAGANSSKTYTVTVVSDSGNKYRFDGHGTSAVTLDLEEGSTYVFDSSDTSVDSHPFVIGTSANSNEYSTGVTYTLDGVTKTYSQYTSGFAAATTRKLTITVPSGAPTLYYWCSAHSGMGGQINTNSTAGATVLSGSLRAASAVNSGNDYSAGYAGHNPVGTWSDTDSWSGLPAVSNGQKGYFSGTETLSNGSVISAAANPKPFGAVANGSQGFVLRASTTVTLRLLVQSHVTEIATTSSDSQTFGDRTIVATNPASGSYVEATGKCFWWSGNTNYPSISVMGTLYDAPQQPTISSTVRANASAGFSIVTYTGNGHSQAVGSSTATVGHGLNAQPEFIIVKNLDDTNGQDWSVYHVGTDLTAPKDYYLALNKPDGRTANSSSDKWSDVAPTSSVFTLGSSASVNRSNDDHVAYCFASVEGYSRFGSYVANADSNSNGPFVFTGFRPRWIMTKQVTGTTDAYSAWLIVDTERDTYNVADESLFANKDTRQGRRGTGSGSAGTWMDIVSNGFKIRYNGTELNGTDGDTYIYAAFAENPFKYSRAR
jgi:hypothetical protein